MMMNWTTPPKDFQFVFFERVERAENIARYYFVAWLPTLFDDGAVVRIYGRKGDAQKRIMAPQPFDSLDEAWPLIRSIIRARLRHNYQIVEPVTYIGQE
jgi:predicted DNA-binding WGR domain protein